MDKTVGLIIPSSTRTMTRLHCRTHDDSRVNLLSWLSCSIGWAYGLISGRYSAWSAPMPGGGDPVGGGIRATGDGRRVTGDGRGYLLPGATEGTVTGQGVRGVDSGWIFGRAQDDTTWESGRGDTDLENLNHGGISADVSHGLPVQGRPAGLPGRGIHRTSRRCGYIFCSGMSWTSWSFLRRETFPTHGAPNATCWSPGVH